VDVPRDAGPEAFLAAHPQLAGKRLVLFMSRLHPKKGIDILCRAWGGVRKNFPDTHLVFAGSDFENTKASTESLLRELGAAESATFTGMLSPALKWSALAAAEMFVLPSYSEGFSVALLEAVAMGVPVIATHPCNFPEIAKAGCGMMIDPDAEQLKKALSAMLGSPAADLRAMGRNGRELVESGYTWPQVGRKMAAAYDWILGGPAPESVPVFV
jgi:glycosyltransferase involved in cell wall biosynthesis